MSLIDTYLFFILSHLEEITMTDLQGFMDYVWEFYNPTDGIYPIKGLTMKDIFNAIKE